MHASSGEIDPAHGDMTIPNACAICREDESGQTAGESSVTHVPTGRTGTVLRNRVAFEAEAGARLALGDVQKVVVERAFPISCERLTRAFEFETMFKIICSRT